MTRAEAARRCSALALIVGPVPVVAQQPPSARPAINDPGPLNPPVAPSPVPAAESGVAPPRPVPAWLRNRSVVRETSVFVKNGLSAPLSCRADGSGMPTAPFTIAGGGEFSRTVPLVQEGPVRIRCGRPTDGVTYRLKPGGRHVFLMNRARGLAELRVVDFGTGR